MATKQRRARTTRLADRTCARFLNAAEQLFAAHGYDGTTIRAIAARAGVNLGTLGHYWGSKRALFRDVFERRFRPLNDEHVRRLKKLAQGRSARKPVDVYELLLALIEPPFVVSRGQAAAAGNVRAGRAEQKLFHLIYGRALTDPSAEVVAAMNRIFRESIDLFFALLRQRFPHLDAQDFFWRTSCVVGAQVFSQSYTERIAKFVAHDASAEDATVAAHRIVHFLVSGMLAPAFSQPRTAVGQ